MAVPVCVARRLPGELSLAFQRARGVDLWNNDHSHRNVVGFQSILTAECRQRVPKWIHRMVRRAGARNDAEAFAPS
jgi:hypothetical protein